jgi:elongation factor G
MGELHLDIIVDRMRREFKVEATVATRHQVAYRETITRTKEKDYTHKQTGGTGQFARVKIIFEPNPDGDDFVFDRRSSAARCRRNSSPACRRA